MPFIQFVNCHCGRCRKATGSAHAANAQVLPAAFRWLRGETELVRYDLPAARSFSVAFCRQCGSQMPHATRSGSQIIVPAGTLDDDPGVTPSQHVFWSSRAAWLSSDLELPKVD